MPRPRVALALLLLLPAALAGCMRPEPDPGAPDDCEGWSQYWCERGDPEPCPADGTSCEWTPPPVRRAPPAPYRECGAVNGSAFYEVSALCAAPEPPLLAAFETQLVARCDACRGAAVAVRGSDVLVASEIGLHVVAPDGRATHIPAPHALAPLPLAWAQGAPHLQVDDTGRAWYAALAEGPAGARILVLAFWEGGDAWAFARTVDAREAPLLPLADRAWVASTGGTLVVVLAGADAAWALRSSDGGATFLPPEALTPPGGAARFGAPSVDHRGRILVPFAFDAMAIDEALAPVTAAQAPPTLHYAAYAEGAGEWTFHGGVPVPQGVAAGARPALAAAEVGATFTWPDASGALARLDVSDDGAGWSTPTFWTVERTAGAPALARDTYEPPCDDTGHCIATPGGARVTAAWWQESGALVVARSLWQDRPATQHVAVVNMPGSGAALALGADGGAVVAWVDAGELWVGLERRSR